MARFLTITSGGNIQDQVKRKKTIRHNLKVGPVTLCFASLTILCLVSLFYLTQTNQIATKGYEIRDLEKRLSIVEESNRKLEIRAAELQAVRNVEGEVIKLNMVPIEKMVYISDSGNAMAMNKK